MSRYTEGPWRAAPAGRVIAQDGEWRLQVCKVGAFDDPEMLRHSKSRWEADTHLIAAAPEMLDALDKMLSRYGYETCEYVQLAIAALAKAKGDKA